MLTKILTITVICMGVYFVAQKVFDMWREIEPPEIRPKFTEEYTTTLEDGAAGAPPTYSPSGTAEYPTTSPPPEETASQLPGLPANLEASLANAKQNGAQGLKAWLIANRSKVQDPRLADIELDYVILVSRENIIAARKAFKKVNGRIAPGSPIYPRIEQLRRTYE